MNYDDGFGPLGDDFKLQTNIPPVIPFEPNEHWNLITRTIIPVIHQKDLLPGEPGREALPGAGRFKL